MRIQRRLLASIKVGHEKNPARLASRAGQAGYLDRRSGASKQIVSLSRCGTITGRAICVDKCRAFIRHKQILADGLSAASRARPFPLATHRIKFRPVCWERASIFRIRGSCRAYPVRPTSPRRPQLCPPVLGPFLVPWQMGYCPRILPR